MKGKWKGPAEWERLWIYALRRKRAILLGRAAFLFSYLCGEPNRPQLAADDMEAKNVSIQDYTYSLPPEKIAAFPLPRRSDAKLLIYRQGTLRESIYQNIGTELPANTLLVFNNTRVVEARVLFQKPTGAHIEIFCLEPHPRFGTVQAGLQQTGSVSWLCLIGGASKWKHGQVLEKQIGGQGSEQITLQASIAGKESGSFVVNWAWSRPELSFGEVLQLAGLIPLPPYIKRPAEALDRTRYQTVYASREGSVAAPTAGLHFTTELLQQLKSQAIQTAELTLHVGAGTFKPVSASQMGGHDMHAEFFEVNRNLVEVLLHQAEQGKPLAAVGTTSMRTLETLYWLGVKAQTGNLAISETILLQQWEAYELPQDIPAESALRALLRSIDQLDQPRLLGKTQLLIVPGYRFRLVDLLATNFHQPGSTLLLLVAAFMGNDWKNLYSYALEHHFRFLSYGDGCLLFRQ